MTHIVKTYINILVMATARAQESDLDSLRQSVPGEPGTDYPILAAIPDTDFSCQVTSDQYDARIQRDAFRTRCLEASMLTPTWTVRVTTCVSPTPRTRACWCLLASSAPMGQSSIRSSSPASGGEWLRSVI